MATRRGDLNRAPGLFSSDQVDDPWNLWTFRVNGNGNFTGEERRVTRRFSGGLNASRVTPTWKQSYRGFLNYNFQKNKFSDGSKFVDRRTDWNFNSTVIYSVAQFWSLGFTSRVGRNIRENQLSRPRSIRRSSTAFSPTTKRPGDRSPPFTRSGPAYFDYIEVTVDDRFKETRYQEALTLEVSQRQTWGDVRVNIRGSHYFHDFERNNLDIGGNVSFRIMRGLNLYFGGNYSLVADQLYLPLDELSDEQLLTGGQAGAYGQAIRLLRRIVVPVRLNLQQCRE